APPAVVFSQVYSLKNWHSWSPWVELDPSAAERLDGPPEGPGATLYWNGNDQVGEGSMKTLESKENEFIKFRLDFIRPFESSATAEFRFKPTEAGTLVSWTMEGQNNLIGKTISLFLDCDKMVGAQFEKGLENLRVVSTAALEATEKEQASSDASEPA
ncbi:MAG: SRPBCC family protein, partial [Bdellovibrionales bacterium]|nr:SRPBCC family protein [Bdellovibrionales bacterium]